jgi:hypothetical protein
MKGKIVIAAFNTTDDLPSSKTRIATLHLRVGGGQAPRYAVALDVAASTEGNPIGAEATLEEGR